MVEADEALKLLPEDYVPVSTDWKMRYQMNLDLLKSGSVMDIATVVRTLYMGVLARKPSDKETKLTLAHVKNVNDREAAFEDILWSLVNSAEFTSRR